MSGPKLCGGHAGETVGVALAHAKPGHCAVCGARTDRPLPPYPGGPLHAPTGIEPPQFFLPNDEAQRPTFVPAVAPAPQASKDPEARRLREAFAEGAGRREFADMAPADVGGSGTMINDSELAGGLARVAKETADPVYLERARVLAVATKMALALGMRCGLARHPEEDASWEPAWRTIVFLDLPTGQASWHLHDSQVHLFAHLPTYDGGPWDGHSTVEKYARCEAFCLGRGA